MTPSEREKIMREYNEDYRAAMQRIFDKAVLDFFEGRQAPSVVPRWQAPGKALYGRGPSEK